MNGDKTNKELLESAFPEKPVQFDFAVRKALEEVQNMQKKHVRRTFALVVFLSLALIGSALAITNAVGVLNFFDRTLPDEYQTVQKDAYSLVKSDIASYDFEHVTVSVKEAIYDGEMLRVVVSIRDRAATAPFEDSDALMNGQISFEAAEKDRINWSIMDWLYIDGKSVCPEGETGLRAGTENGEVLQYIQTYVDKSTVGDSFTVSLPLQRPEGRYEKDENGELIDPTPKELTFTLSSTNLPGVTYLKTGQTRSYDSYSATVEKALISPLRVYVNVRFDAMPGAPDNIQEEIERIWFVPAVTDKDGNILLTEADSSVGVPYGDAEKYGTTTVFAKYLTRESYPDELFLAPLDENGKPMMDMAIQIR